MSRGTKTAWAAAIAELRGHGVARHLRPGQAVVRQGEPSTSVVIVDEGYLRVARLWEDGTEAILAVRGAGSLCGEMGVLHGIPRSADLVALGSTVVTVVRADAFVEALERQPGLALAVLRMVLDRQREADDQNVAQRTQSLDVRIATRLLMAGPEAEHEFELRLSQEEVGRLVGASRTEVNRAIGVLRTAGVLETGRGRIRIRPIALRDWLAGAPGPAV